MIKRAAILGIAIVVTLSISLSKTAYAENAVDYIIDTGSSGCVVNNLINIPEGYPPVPERTIWLGEIKGSWYEIGRKWGQKISKYINYGFDYRYPNKEEEYGARHVVEDMYRYEMKIQEFYAPFIEWMRGVADGAKNALEETQEGQYLSAYEKVLFLNVDTEFERHPNDSEHFPIELPPDTEKRLSALGSIRNKSVRLASAKPIRNDVVDDCSAIIVLPAATANGKLMHTHNNQQGGGFGVWANAFIAVLRGTNAPHTGPGVFLRPRATSSDFV